LELDHSTSEVGYKINKFYAQIYIFSLSFSDFFLYHWTPYTIASLGHWA